MTDVPSLEDIQDTNKLEAWLLTKPKPVSVILAARAAQRAIMCGFPDLDVRDDGQVGVILPTFRATAAPWVAAKYTTQGAELDRKSVV